MTMDEVTAQESGDRAIREVMSTQVGRRWLLRMGGVAGVGLALSAITAQPAGAATAASAVRSAATAGGGRPPRGGTRKTVFHFALRSVADATGLTARLGEDEITLTRHTSASRAKLTRQGSVWGKLDRKQLTHYATLKVPPKGVALISVHGVRGGGPVLLAQHRYVPATALRTVAMAAYRIERSYRSVIGSDDRLGRLGVRAKRITSVTEVLDLDTVVDTEQTAIAITMLHPNVATRNTTAAATTKVLLGQTPEVAALGTQIYQMQQAGQDVATEVPALNADGTPTQISVGGQTATFSTLHLSQDSGFQAIAKTAFIAGIHGVRDTGSLGSVLDQPIDALQNTGDTGTWHAAEGVSPPITPYAPEESATVTASVKNPGLLYGTYTTLVGSYSGGQQQLKLYNNYVRWVWVYVQYLDAAGNNLSIATGPTTFPDTTYAKSLGVLPQIFTVVGVPIWDTNTLTVNLNFPTDATSARILYCGLGNQGVDGGWRQYFPAAAYPAGLIAPTKEVEIASFITGIFTIGLTAFALLTDLDIATTWAEVRELIDDEISDVGELIDAVLARPPWLAASDAIAATLAAGAATTVDITGNGGSPENVWGILAGLGALIPKILFNPAATGLVVKVATALLGAETADKILQALPGIGQVMEVIAAVGDVATLAEAIGESIASPWVISNTVTLTYPATVTVSRDPRSATWPPTGRTWRIEAKIDGASALPAVTGDFNADGTQSEPIELTVAAPFGGATITWSMVVLDGDGHQVGTGSVQFPDNDASNLPTTVAFAIVELPATVDASTVFSRAITTGYGADGYTWALASPDTGTVESTAVQEITGVTISTRLGVAGIVWKQDDKYWLRGVPIAEDGNSISLGGATVQGYARRPYLLFDALVGAGDIGNHVLLEPDDVDAGYHVRALTIDPTSGALSWDPTTSLGTFTLPVDAAGLAPSGWVVAINTDSGRVGTVLPAATPAPPLASYTGGPGTQAGLLSSPTAIAVTNRGIVIVLETNVAAAAPGQLAAFDVLGNPVRLFGTQAPLAFTLALPAGRTYLDVALDGSDHLYVLNYSGDGTAPADYRIDVYNPDGSPLATNSPGSNVPHLAVDYWRSIYAANFTALLDSATGQPRIDPALGVAEPSLSRWDPAG